MLITNEDFEAALEDIDNKRIMRAACKKYKPYLDADTLHGCRIIGLWKCLKKQSDGEAKFTTRLFNYVKWECQKELVRNNKSSATSLEVCGVTVYAKPQENTRLSHVFECMDKMSEEEQELIRYRYVEGMTLKEIGRNYNVSKETARQRINRAITKLKRICSN